MDFIIVGITAFLVGIITLFSGFGLGTILMPVLALFFPVNIAIGLTAIVHLTNSFFRSALLFRAANIETILKFGLPAIFAAFLGAYTLSVISSLEFIISYQLFGYGFEVTLINFMIAVLILIFLVFEMIPKRKEQFLNKKYLPIGGILSGFFGGLSGHQGAFRSAFLVQANLSGSEFIATSAVISILVDASRLIIYGIKFAPHEISGRIIILLVASLAAILGSFIGTFFIKKVTISFIKSFVAVLLFAIAILLMLGIA